MKQLRQRLLAVVAALAVCGLLLVGLELVLRAAGLGARPPGQESQLEYQRVYLPALVPHELADGTPILRTVDPRHPFQWVAPQKPEGALRVFCFGGSASAGLGFSPNVTFARALEEMLRAAHPERAVEVVNLGMVALPSTGVVSFVRDVCARYEPDLLVVYSGNNEFLEVHSEAYFQATASLGTKLQRRLLGTHLARLLGGGGGSERPTITTRDVAANDARVSHREMLQHIVLPDAELQRAFDRYERNLEAMCDAAEEAETALVLCTVATNWEWWGMQDPDVDAWLQELGADRASAPAAIDAALADADAHHRHQWTYLRAWLARERGDHETARGAYRASMNADPHLRRAVDALAERVREVAARRGASLFDAIEFLAADDEHGVVGFDHFYDYVHFTPRGAWMVGAGVYASMVELGLVAETTFDAVAFAESRLGEIDGREVDFLDVDRFLGVGLDAARVADRDLWKYDRMQDELDARLEADASDARALALRGNARFFAQGGRAGAEEDYRASLAVEESAAVRANLERLLGTRRP